jgi:hypothetical protein
MSTTAPYPHEGGCPQCRELRVCNSCGAALAGDLGRCTNGRCGTCHRLVCVNTTRLFSSERVHGYGIHGHGRRPHFRTEGA